MYHSMWQDSLLLKSYILLTRACKRTASENTLQRVRYVIIFNSIHELPASLEGWVSNFFFKQGHFVQILLGSIYTNGLLFYGSPEDTVKATPLQHIPWGWPMSLLAVKMHTGKKCQWSATRHKCVHKTNIHEGGQNETSPYVDRRVGHRNCAQKSEVKGYNNWEKEKMTLLRILKWLRS